jgi:photosystem II stability/assembly factor-like uncharacterized protein
MRLRVLAMVTAVVAVTGVASVIGAGPGRAAVAPGAVAPGAVAPGATASWHVGLSMPGVTTNSDYISCGSATNCQAVGATVTGSSLMGTSDGGKTWAGEQMPAGIIAAGPTSCGSATACQVLAVTAADKFALIGTANAGKTWTAEQIPAGAGLSAVSCANPSDCQASGAQSSGAGSMIGTTNGGKTWTTETLPSAAGQVFGVSCATSADCQAVAVDSSGSSGVILGTSNGGKTWTTEKSLSGRIMFVVACGSSSACQALGETSAGVSVVLGTANGGKAWTAEKLPSGAFPTVVSCDSASDCLAAGQTKAGVATYTTSSGGKTWQAAGAPAGFSGVNGISCHTNCVAAGEGTTGIGVFASSGNAGKTWAAGRLPVEFYALNALACPSGCLAAGASAYGGAVVSAAPGGHLPPAGTQLLSSSGALSGVACHATTCVAVGPNGAWVSAAGGKTWRPARLPAGTGALSAVSCASATDCVAAGRGGTAVVTADGGKTWHTDKLSSGVYAITGVSCGSPAFCVAISESQQGIPFILEFGLHSAAHAATSIPTQVAKSLTAVACGSATTCHIAGQTASGGELEINTTDGGMDWTSGALPASVTSVTGMACASATSCDAIAGTATGQNEILTTANSGKSWTGQTVPAGVTGLTAITCESTGCVAAGTDTADGTVVLQPGAGTATLQAAARQPITTATWARTRWAHAAPRSEAAPAGFKAVSLNWINSQQGWVLGMAPCGTKTCSDVLTTSDGGRSWSVAGTVPAPIPQPYNGQGVTEIALSTPQDGWAFRPGLFATTNGGSSWTQQTIPGGGKQVLALSTNTDGTYIITSPCAVGSSSCTPKSLTLWRRSGTSWTKVPITVPNSNAPTLAAYGKTVYVGGPYNNSESSFLFASTDGVHFATRPQPCAASQAIQLTSIAATSASRVALLCDGNPGFSQAIKIVYLSSDTGKTDKYAGELGLIGIQAELTESPSGNLAVASSSDGSFIYINDSRSTTWTMPVGFGDGGLGWGDIQYVTDNTAWVVYSPGNKVDGLGKVLITRDGGRHWTLVAL